MGILVVGKVLSDICQDLHRILNMTNSSANVQYHVVVDDSMYQKDLRMHSKAQPWKRKIIQSETPS
jgi:hypothetical protein